MGHKIHIIQCPYCQKEREVTYGQAWNIKVGNCTGRCNPCASKGRVNSGTFKKGHVAWNKGKKWKQKNYDKEAKKQVMLETLKKHGHPSHRPEVKKKMREAKLGKYGPESNAWKGGKTTQNILERRQDRYKVWRMDVFKKDNYTCQHCKKRGGKIHAHHVKFFAKYPELRFEIDNGLTLCRPCHHKVHWGKSGTSKIHL